ncbi:TPA: hypothetical protein KPF65_002768 [Clostridioides difficile]|uniref:hypothetical protein n=1 Tax=Clostridioides TaxID=1870884 RepID=UPI000D1FC548|nr:hypothetical protein [Clostridioides difficile]MCC0697676.1 hypothetical protein [Clostridioides sp. ES-S-0048-02]MCM4098618.1 hypothetical protein [Clostridioides difficile]MCR1515733.1 hypothetical protein [Clostridioides difficile]MCZ1036405.1 hypothetical protein [Clostridioides difficile]MDM0363857.1 hypothetical protein [Clostridioides difficile]
MLKLYILSIIVFCTGLYLLKMRVDGNKELIELFKSMNVRKRKKYNFIFLALFPLLNFILGVILIPYSLLVSNENMVKALRRNK